MALERFHPIGLGQIGWKRSKAIRGSGSRTHGNLLRRKRPRGRRMSKKESPMPRPRLRSLSRKAIASTNDDSTVFFTTTRPVNDKHKVMRSRIDGGKMLQ